MPWSSSDRASRLPRDWQRRRAAVKARAQGMCQAGCGRPGAECDHIQPGDDHSLSNLQWLCKPCHQVKTLGEAQQGRGYRGRLRPTPRHPGAI